MPNEATEAKRCRFFPVELARGAHFSSKLWKLQVSVGEVTLRRHALAHFLSLGLTRLPWAAGPFEAVASQVCVSVERSKLSTIPPDCVAFRTLEGHELFAVIPAPTHRGQLVEAIQEAGFRFCCPTPGTSY